jgi:hypothetical protein
MVRLGRRRTPGDAALSASSAATGTRILGSIAVRAARELDLAVSEELGEMP